MHAQSRERGYTITEVMMFLAISGVIFLIAGTYIGGQQQATRFSQALNDLESKIQDTVNNVATGNYPDAGKFICSANAASGRLDFTAGSSGQGTNKECVFIGKFIQLAPQGATDGLNIYTIAGRRLDNTGHEIQQLDDSLATPVALSSNISNTSGIDLTDRELLKWGLMTTRIVTASTHQDVSAIGIISDFGRYGNAGTSNLVSGAQSVTLALPLGSLGQNDSSTVSVIKALKETDRIRGREGAIICFRGANNDRKGAITITQQGGTNVLIDQTDAVVGAGICP